MSLRWRPRLKVYKNYNGNNEVNLETLEAWSYKWWKYLTVYKGIIVFNDYSFSVTTSSHQNECKGLLYEHNMLPDIIVNTSASLGHSVGDILKDHLKNLYSRIAKTNFAISRKGSKKSKNQERLKEIEGLYKEIESLKAKTGLSIPNKDLENIEIEAMKDEFIRLSEIRTKSIKIKDDIKESFNSLMPLETKENEFKILESIEL